LPGVGSLAPRLTKPLCRRGKIELEAEYLAWRRQYILPGVGSMAPRLVESLYRKGRTGGRISYPAPAAWLPDWSNLYTGREELEAEYLTRRRQHGSQTYQTFMQEGKNRTGSRISCPAPAACLQG
jgi:hypothetical protein